MLHILQILTYNVDIINTVDTIDIIDTVDVIDLEALSEFPDIDIIKLLL